MVRRAAMVERKNLFDLKQRESILALACSARVRVRRLARALLARVLGPRLGPPNWVSACDTSAFTQRTSRQDQSRLRPSSARVTAVLPPVATLTDG